MPIRVISCLGIGRWNMDRTEYDKRLAEARNRYKKEVEDLERKYWNAVDERAEQAKMVGISKLLNPEQEDESE